MLDLFIDNIMGNGIRVSGGPMCFKILQSNDCAPTAPSRSTPSNFYLKSSIELGCYGLPADSERVCGAKVCDHRNVAASYGRWWHKPRVLSDTLAKAGSAQNAGRERHEKNRRSKN